jgi:hypothetical protein
MPVCTRSVHSILSNAPAFNFVEQSVRLNFMDRRAAGKRVLEVSYDWRKRTPLAFLRRVARCSKARNFICASVASRPAWEAQRALPLPRVGSKTVLIPDGVHPVERWSQARDASGADGSNDHASRSPSPSRIGILIWPERSEAAICVVRADFILSLGRFRAFQEC